MEAYGYHQQIITDLNSIDINSDNFYNYKNLNFLSKLNSKNENIVFSFHGSIPGSGLGKHSVIFRGYDYSIPNTDIVCISDFLLDKYTSNYCINWTLSSKKYNFTDNIYKDIFFF